MGADMQDRMEFVKKLSALAETLGAKMSEAKLWIYEQALRRFSDEQIRAAISAAASTLTFFPKPVELIELIEGKREEQSTLAWEVLLNAMQHVGAYQSVEFEDGRIARAVRLLGGWQKACSTETKYLNHFRNDFVKIYNSLPVDTEQEALEGIGELSAMAEGYLDRIKPPVRIGGGAAVPPDVLARPVTENGGRKPALAIDRPGAEGQGENNSTPRQWSQQHRRIAQFEIGGPAAIKQAPCGIKQK